MLNSADNKTLPDRSLHFPGRARNVYTPKADVLKLGENENRDVRCEVAENLATPENLLRKLSDDPDINVRLRAKENLDRNAGFREWFPDSWPARVAGVTQ
jgi:hypothetical protein